MDEPTKARLLDQARQILERGKSRVAQAAQGIATGGMEALTRQPGAWGKLDPGSLYGQYQVNPQQAMMSSVMGMAAPVSSAKVGQLTSARKILNRRWDNAGPAARKQIEKAIRQNLKLLNKATK